jgi:AcrR family transcriptional regulator
MATQRRQRLTQAERRARTRDALLAAAEALFSKRGYAATTVEAIADKAGFTTGALYDHFGSKQGTLIALMEERMATDPLQWAEIVDPQDPFPEQLRALGRAAAENVARTPAATPLWLDVYASAARNRELKVKVAKVLRDALRERGEAIPLAGPLSGTDVIVLAQALLDGLRIRAGLNPELVRPDLFEEGLALLAHIPGMSELVAGVSRSLQTSG